ncbi:MAG: DNA-directed RNA polymerase subunit B [Desulfurococcaceae archaeon]
MSSAATPETLSPEDLWTLMRAFVEEKGLVRQHLDSYNRFVKETLREILEEFREIPIGGNMKLVIKDYKIGRPTWKSVEGVETEVTPMECRLRNLTYAAPLFVKLVLYDGMGHKREIEAKLLDLPVMLKSDIDPLSKLSPDELVEIGEDPKDPGGYFIINGSEKVVVAHEDLASNNIIVDVAPEGASYTHVAKVVSIAKGRRSQLIIERKKDGSFEASFQGYRIPVVVLMMALGLTSEAEVLNAISLDPEVQLHVLPSLMKAQSLMPSPQQAEGTGAFDEELYRRTVVEEALDYIGRRIASERPREERIKRALRVLDEYLLPHIGTEPNDATRRKKAIFIGQMVCKIVEVMLKRRPPDDKDHYRNKRLKLAGDLLAVLFRYAMLTSFVREVKSSIEKAYSKYRKVDLKTIIKPGMLSERILHAMATGNWPGGRTGVTQLLDRTNLISTLSHLRRVVSPLARTQPHFEARELHMTSWGRICPFETPEGANIGLVKNLALTSHVSVGVPEEKVEPMLYKLGVKSLEEILEEIRASIKSGAEAPSYVGWSKVFLNGRLIGYHPNGAQLADLMRRLRRQGKISHEINVAHIKSENINEVYVNCDPGRIRRPLIVVEEGKPKVTREHVEALRRGEIKFEDLVRAGLIEYIDADEEENVYVALKPEEVTAEHTHMEIWLPGVFGVAALTIPYAEHNQSPRNMYQSAMSKQALGLYASNYQRRIDTRGHFLHYPQKPLVQTKALDVIGYNERPAGQNAVVAVLTYSGYNMEDALVMNKGSVERGFGRSTFFRLYTTVEYKYPGGQEDEITRPPSNIRGYKGPRAYEKLDDDGLVSPETPVAGGDVLIGKVSPPRFMAAEEYAMSALTRQDTSVTMRYEERGVVDVVMLTTDNDGNRLVKVRVRDLRIPELGDKFASRHGQKGVVGLLLSQEDMPFTEDGVVPDIIINPHAFPSRMTVGQLIESIAGKVAALEGRLIDGTPYYGGEAEELMVVLKRHGYPHTGEEAMYDGRTGELLRTPVFIGVVYYQKLHHMVSDKIHARARGPIQILTRQPTEGRARAGGLRWGEMEVDCLVAHGASSLLKETMTDRSDKVVVYVCELCGHIGYFDRVRGRYMCPIHKDKGVLKPVEITYAFKLLLQELMSMCIVPRIKLKDVRKG